MPNSLYERIGGEPAVRATVSKMYTKILADKHLKKFFDGVDMARLEHSQSAFVTYAFGGPNHYNGNSLRTVHAKSVAGGLTDIHFDSVQEHLRSAMIELGVDPLLIQEAMQIVSSTRKDVLNR